MNEPLQATLNIVEGGATYRFVLQSRGTPVQLILRDEFGSPLAQRRYQLEAGIQRYEGVTGADGLVSQKFAEKVPTALLTVYLDDEDPDDTLTMKLQIGDLPPIEQISGVQARLNNLGYDCGEVNGQINDATKAALRAFQQSIDLANPSGELDDKTRAELARLYDGT